MRHSQGRNCADDQVELRRVFTSQQNGRLKVEHGLDAAAGGGRHVPGIEADVRAEARVVLWMAVVSRMREEGGGKLGSYGHRGEVV
jgi:hypothetical protein